MGYFLLFSAPVQDRGRTGVRKKQIKGKWVIFYYFQPRSKTGAGPGHLKVGAGQMGDFLLSSAPTQGQGT